MQKDRLGSTKQILDETGQVLHTKSYDAFGKPRNRYRFSIQCVLLVSGIYPTQSKAKTRKIMVKFDNPTKSNPSISLILLMLTFKKYWSSRYAVNKALHSVKYENKHSNYTKPSNPGNKGTDPLNSLFINMPGTALIKF